MTYNGVDFEILFSGVNDGHDSDLLCCDKVAEKLPAPTLARCAVVVERPSRGVQAGCDAVYAGVCAALQTEHLTRTQLRERCGYTSRQVERALTRGQRSGLLCEERTETGTWGRPTMQYWMD